MNLALIIAFTFVVQSCYCSAPSGCGGPEHRTDPVGSISTMNFGDPSWPFYDPDAICQWKLEAPTGHLIELEFVYLDVGSFNTGSCGYDAVYIFDSKEAQGRPTEIICGQTLPSSPFQSSGNHMFIGFSSDSSGQGLGFKATYKHIPPLPPTLPAVAASGCGDLKYRTDNHGIITSMNYDGTTLYDPDAECTWIISAPQAKLVLLTFKHFDVEDANCRDILFIYDGSIEKNPTSPIIGRFCGSNLPYPLLSSNNSLTVVFYSSSSVQKTGFKIEYNITEEVTCPQGMYQCLDNSCIADTKLCDSVFDCADESDESGCPGNRIDCGKPVVAKGSIVGGTEAKPGAWPWQVQISKVSDGGHICGGSLLNQRWMLSAAHCFANEPYASSYKLHLGSHNKYIEDATEQIHQVDRIIIHKQYGVGHTYDYDIALVKLKEQAEITDYVRTVCLPGGGDVYPPGKDCYVTGWGETKGTGFETVLKEAVVPLLQDQLCNSTNYYNGDISARMMCAGDGGEDTCMGDSGGPLVCLSDVGSWDLVGVTSWGTGCANSFKPGVYTRTSYFNDWITETIIDNL